MQVKAPRGTYDVLPSDAVKWSKFEKIVKETAAWFGFQEIRTPIFEHTELFERGVGETTDIVSKEMYTFLDKGARSLTLRPEGTAGCVRAFVEHKLYNGILPYKCYYVGPMFRYDRPQTGRYRQFHQFGVEAFGSNNPYLDAEVITLMVEIVKRLGIKNFALHLNSVGCPECRRDYRDKLIKFIEPHRDRLCKDCLVRYEKNPLRVLDCKQTSCQQVIVGAPVMFDHLCDNCRDHYNKVQKALEINNVEYIHDNNLVRGLDYYTNTAFEILISDIGSQSAVGGGGRYNGLIKQCGGPELPGIGFALGIERLLLAMDENENQAANALDVFIAIQDEEYLETGIRILNELRLHHIKADKDYNERSFKAQMKHADKLGAQIVIIVGTDEVENKYFSLRNMKNGQQIKVEWQQLIATVKDMLI